ncbi:MAG: SDR family oxidoreductase [Gammaproteobacteria bacterium]|nr:SDR family oxidoreductase [Gammaproteobacteria bacterium]
MLLKGKVALITGSARGTGAGIAHVFAQHGARVVVNQVKDEGDPEAVMSSLKEAGADALFVKADVTDKAQVAEMIEQTERAFGGVDILVNNYAASVPRSLFMDSQWSAWQEQFDYTVKAAHVCCQAVVPGMRERKWGRLISVNTVGIHQPRLTYHGYTAAKTAMLGFSRNLAAEVGVDNITVNVVSPGLTLTKEVQARLSPEERASHIKRIPMGRVGTVEDTANAALFLASDLGSFVTGHYLPVCGGQVFV